MPSDLATPAAAPPHDGQALSDENIFLQRVRGSPPECEPSPRMHVARLLLDAPLIAVEQRNKNKIQTEPTNEPNPRIEQPKKERVGLPTQKPIRSSSRSAIAPSFDRMKAQPVPSSTSPLAQCSQVHARECASAQSFARMKAQHVPSSVSALAQRSQLHVLESAKRQVLPGSKHGGCHPIRVRSNRIRKCLLSYKGRKARCMRDCSYICIYLKITPLVNLS